MKFDAKFTLDHVDKQAIKDVMFCCHSSEIAICRYKWSNFEFPIAIRTVFP